MNSYEDEYTSVSYVGADNRNKLHHFFEAFKDELTSISFKASLVCLDQTMYSQKTYPVYSASTHEDIRNEDTFWNTAREVMNYSGLHMLDIIKGENGAPTQFTVTVSPSAQEIHQRDERYLAFLLDRRKDLIKWQEWEELEFVEEQIRVWKSCVAMHKIEWLEIEEGK